MSTNAPGRLARAFFGLVMIAALFAASTALATAPAKKAAPPSEFLPFSPITVSVLDRVRARGFLTVEFGLYVKDKDLRSAVEQNRRALNDSYVRVLADYGAGVARINVPLDLEGISDRLQRATDSMLGQAGARVLLSQAQLRKLH
jgi:hypothetical protein